MWRRTLGFTSDQLPVTSGRFYRLALSLLLIACLLRMRLVLIGRKLPAWGDLLVLRWVLLSEAAGLLGRPAGLLTECALIALVQLACGCTYLCLCSTIRLPVIGPTQQNVDEVHHRAVNEH